MKKYTYNQLEIPLLETLQELGGKADTKNVYDQLAKKMDVPEEIKNEKINDNSSHRRWDRTVRWVKQNLTLDSYIKSESKGIWALTEKGKTFLKNARPGILIKVYEVVDEKGDVQGIALWGETATACSVIEDGTVNLILTSPPFPLAWEMPYGNKAEDEYIDWFLPLAEQFRRLLTEDGSLILDLRNTYKKKLPTQSLYIHKLAIALCEEMGFYLAQEHFSHNSGALPTSNWVTVKRIRVTGSVNTQLWLSKNPYPKADNRHVLTPYSEKYMKQLKNGGYPAYRRSSGHVIDRFNKDNGGRIPSNLISANTVANTQYIRYCKANNLIIHPARFSSAVPEHFIKLTTDPGDIVYDPFCGSNEVGRVCRELGRRFIANDKSLTYLQGSIGQFPKENIKLYV